MPLEIVNDGTLTPESARRISEQFIKAIPPFPSRFQGRGIVIPAGGLTYFANAWVCIKMLRYLGCRLPIQVWHFGEREVDDTMRGLLKTLDSECVDAFQVHEQYPMRVGGGWPVKAYAVLHSSFKEILLLDADNVPVVNPEYLFECPQFKETGAIFWPDFESFQSTHPIWDLCGVPYRDEPEVESGQFVVDKERCWEALCLSQWYNDHADFYYDYIYGDKDTFHMAFRKLNTPYAMPETRIHYLQHTMCQHDFAGNRVFQHRNFDKWNLVGYNKHIHGFLHEDKCLEFLNELRGHLEHKWKYRRYFSGVKSERIQSVAKRIVNNLFNYERVDCDRRFMTFLEDGTVGLGCGRFEALWNLKAQDGKILLEISSADELTCCLIEDSDSTWRGNWVCHGRMPVELSPVKRLLPKDSKSQRIRSAINRIINTQFDYRRVGFDSRLLTFLENGLVGRGAAGCEVFWNLRETDDQVVLNIASEKEITCELREDADGVWRGRWIHHEKMPVELAPKKIGSLPSCVENK